MNYTKRRVNKIVNRKRNKIGFFIAKYIKRFKYLFYLLIVILIIFTARILFLKIVMIKSIDCKDQYGSCNQSLINKLNVAVGKNLVVSKKEVNKLLTKDKSVSEFSVNYKLPDKFIVYVILKKPKYAIFNDSQKLFAVLDSEGEVLSLEEKTNLPKLKIDHALENVGDYIGNDELFALKLLYDITPYYTLVSGEIENDHLLVSLSDNTEILFPLKGDIRVLLGSFNLIYSRLKTSQEEFRINGSQIKTIDLRYKNPVLR